MNSIKKMVDPKVLVDRRIFVDPGQSRPVAVRDEPAGLLWKVGRDDGSIELVSD